MNELLEKYNEFKSITNYTIEYEFDNGDLLCFKLKQVDFPHLIGLHKLIDIPVIRQFNDKSKTKISAKYIIARIKKEDILTDKIIRSSKYFSQIEDRYNQFSKNNILTLSYTDVIVDFDPTLIKSSLKAKYILFEQKDTHGYNHLCIAEDASCKKYTETFFYEPSDLYIRKQKKLKIRKVKIYDDKGVLYMEDTLL